MQRVLSMQCSICKVSLLISALCAKCHYYSVLYMQSVLIMHCFICKASLLFTALYAKCPYYVVHYMQSFLIIYCFICDVSCRVVVLRLAWLCAHGPQEGTATGDQWALGGDTWVTGCTIPDTCVHVSLENPSCSCSARSGVTCFMEQVLVLT